VTQGCSRVAGEPTRFRIEPSSSHFRHSLYDAQMLTQPDISRFEGETIKTTVGCHGVGETKGVRKLVMPRGRVCTGWSCESWILVNSPMLQRKVDASNNAALAV
jgi:hypothetical protein